MSVWQYFYNTFGDEPQDETLHDLALDSSCGKACKQAIDKAAAYLAVADTHPEVRQPLIASINAAIEVFWRG
jgi:hypothetical protein